MPSVLSSVAREKSRRIEGVEDDSEPDCGQETLDNEDEVGGKAERLMGGPGEKRTGRQRPLKSAIVVKTCDPTSYPFTKTGTDRGLGD